MRKRKLKKPTLAKLMKEADRVFSLFIRARDKKCVICGTTERLQNSHLIRRGKKSIRFDEKNCNTNCATHNYLHNIYPETYTQWFIKRYGLDEYEKLIAKSHIVKQFKASELETLIEKYK